MTIARICERWTMSLPEPGDGRWFLDWALESPKQAGIHLTAGLMAYSAVSGIEIRSAREYFGGIGGQAMMIRSLFSPEKHVVMDYSAAAVKHLETLPVWAVQADAYDPASTAPADLVGLDFGDLTIWKLRPGCAHRALLDRVFLLEPKAVVLTDVAGPRLHLHKERYAGILGKFDDYNGYLELLADFIQDRWGYTMVAGYSHRWSTVMALVPDGQRVPFFSTPERPIGLELL